MDLHLFPSVRCGCLLLAASVTATLPMVGCQSARPSIDTEGTLARVTGLSEPVTFRVEGGPIDDAASGDVLTFADATRRAVTTSPRLQAALARVRAAMADADQARLLPNPVLNFVLRWGPGDPQIEVSLAQDLIQILQMPKRASAADNRLRQSAAEAVTVGLDVVAEVQEHYAEAQLAERLAGHYRGRLELLGQLAQVAQSRLEAGEGVLSDITTLESQRIELEISLDEAEHEERNERLRLARLIGEPSGTADWRLDEWVPPDAAAATEADWIRVALANRPEVEAVAWKLAALGDDYAIAKLLPWEGASIAVDAEGSPDWFAGPSISTPIPIFDTGQARRDKLTAEQIEARHELTLTQRQVVEDVRLAHLGLRESLHHLARVRDELMPLLERRREQAERAYRAGQTDVTELYLAQQDLLAAESLEIEYERETSTAIIRLHRAVGGPGVATSVADSVPVSETDNTMIPPSHSVTAADSRSVGGQQ